MSARLRLVLVRHGETEWSREGRHTGRTDIPLTERGRRQARALQPLLDHFTFTRVLCSPLTRARDTAHLCGLGERAEVCDDLVEWDYGDMDGLTTPEIRRQDPGWSIFESGVTGGENLDQVAARARRVITLCDGDTGDVALVAHGHLLRVLAACWLSLPPVDARLLSLSTATLSVLGWEHETRVVQTWNVSPDGASTD